LADYFRSPFIEGTIVVNPASEHWVDAFSHLMYVTGKRFCSPFRILFITAFFELRLISGDSNIIHPLFV
jgi:hypothetical protein